MKKYYIDQLDLNKIKNLKYKSIIYSEHLILTNTHLIKIINNEYIKYCFIEKQPTIKNNFFENKDLYIDNSFFKKNGHEDQIPYNHEKIEVLYYKYKINNNSKIYFVKEYLNKELIDYYFLSDENVDIVENSIITFLEQLN
tara:strand:- start:111 stop:533 length:423 start_codon:yes stop_codon:yes gene_type:complete